jgi:hypothetical protein
VVSAPDYWPRGTEFESRVNHWCFSSLCIITLMKFGFDRGVALKRRLAGVNWTYDQRLKRIWRIGNGIDILSRITRINADYNKLSCIFWFGNTFFKIGVLKFQIWLDFPIKNHEHEQKRNKKIWCASRARVNLPHIGNRECFKFVLKKSSFNLSKSEFVWEVPF